MGPRAGLDGCGKSRPPTGIRSPDRPARSESLYRLSYPGPILVISPYDISLLCFQLKTSQYMYLNGRLTLNGWCRLYSHKTDEVTPPHVQ